MLHNINTLGKIALASGAISILSNCKKPTDIETVIKHIEAGETNTITAETPNGIATITLAERRYRDKVYKQLEYTLVADGKKIIQIVDREGDGVLQVHDYVFDPSPEQLEKDNEIYQDDLNLLSVRPDFIEKK